MKKHTLILLSCITLFLISNFSLAQKGPFGKFLSGKNDSTRSGSFLPLPAIGYAQETGFEFGVLSLYSFYTNREDIKTRNSSINAIVTFTTKKQSNFKLLGDIWSPQNKYHYVAEIRYKDFPFNFYGVGNRTLQINEDKLTQKLFKLNGEVEKLFSERYYAGISTSFENYSFRDQEPGGIFASSDPFIFDRDGGKVLYIGISQVSDSRNTNTYTTKGSYFKLNYSYAPDLFGERTLQGACLKLTSGILKASIIKLF